jgi:hypothetical protein
MVSRKFVEELAGAFETGYDLKGAPSWSPLLASRVGMKNLNQPLL